MEYVEFRGVDNLVYAEVTKDDAEGFETGDVKELAGAGEISKTTATSSATKYYDNGPRIVINAEGADTITITSSVPILATLAELTGKMIDPNTGAFIDTESEPKYYALGYRFQKTDGTYRYVWRLKGAFGIPDESSKSKDESTDTNNTQLTYTGIETSHAFTVGTKKKAAKAVVVDDTPDSKCDVSTFFDQVTTPETLVAKSEAASVSTMSATANESEPTTAKTATKTTAKTAEKK